MLNGRKQIFVTGHNSHIPKWGSHDLMGESYSIAMRLLPPSYRMFQPPVVLYDSMIFVSDANPTKIVLDK